MFEGEFHWHKHDREDELFYVVEGRLFVDFEDRVHASCAANQGVVVPRGVVHRTRAPVPHGRPDDRGRDGQADGGH